MKRHQHAKRIDWQKAVSKLGLTWFESDKGEYWTEDASYSFRMTEITRLENAITELQRLCLEAVQHVIDKGLWDRFDISPALAEKITADWYAEPPSLYGRFDIAYDQLSGNIKMLEYNADTPTSLLEASVIQWDWLQTVRPDKDQWNSIHERLIEKWTELAKYVRGPLYFAGMQDELHEDWLTLAYLQETATQAGLDTVVIPMELIGHDGKEFVDSRNGYPFGSCFKLYPWEWMIEEEFGPELLRSDVQWIEPSWKLILSSKAILPVLWELNQFHPNLLHASEQPFGFDYVSKPIYSREGQNVTIMNLEASEGEYGANKLIYQAYMDIPKHDGMTPVLGCWVVDGQPAGMGIRESVSLITDNRSRFVPHWIE
jgi:glutathionylspermidine synthase